MNLSAGSIFMFLLSGALVVSGWAWWMEAFDEPGYVPIYLGMILLGAAGAVLSLLPLRDVASANLRRIRRWQAEGLIDEAEAAKLRADILKA